MRGFAKVAVVVAMCVWSAGAWATVGGPSYVTDVRYDAAARTVYYVRQRFDESGILPMVVAFRLGRPDEHVARKVTNPERGQLEFAGGMKREDLRWKRWSERLETHPRLRASMGQPVAIRSLGASTDTCSSPCWGTFVRHLSLVEVRSGDLVGRARVTSYGTRRISIANLYEVPGGRRLAVLRARGIPIEGGYDEDTVVLLTRDEHSARAGGGSR
jgi:hypothetical protein